MKDEVLTQPPAPSLKRKGSRTWQCANGHVLGVIVRNGSKRPLLELYRHAVDLKAEKPAEVDVIGVLSGGMRNIRCDVCWDVKVWHDKPQP